MFDNLNLPQEQYSLAVRDVEIFNETLEPDMVPIKALRNLPTIEYAYAWQLAKKFGFELHCVTRENNGVGICNGKAGFLSEIPESCSDYRPIWVAGHEMWHLLQMTYPEYCDEAGRQIKQYLKSCAYESRRAIEDDDIGRKIEEIFGSTASLKKEPASPEVVWNEVFADASGNMWIDHDFWNSLAERGVGDSRLLFGEVGDYLEGKNLKPYRDWIDNYPCVKSIFIDLYLNFIRLS